MYLWNVATESRGSKVLATRVGELGNYYLTRVLGLSRVQTWKYDVMLPADFNAQEIRDLVYLIRGADYKPAIFIHGVLPRSGTNYLADLFKLHRDIHAHPRQMWEFPLLSTTDAAVQMQNDFARVFRKNADALRPLEFSAYLTAGFMRNLQRQVGADHTMLFKFPYVHNVDMFRHLFPSDFLILLLRDGRDVITSSLKTFRRGFFKNRFSDYSREWSYAARTILKYKDDERFVSERTLVLKYENIVGDPETWMRSILSGVGLNTGRYDWKGLGNLPVRGSSELGKDGKAVHWKPTRRTPDFNPVGRWKSWSAADKKRFKSIAGDALIAAGYEANENW